MNRFFLFRLMDAAEPKRSPRRHRGAKNSAAVKSVCRRSAPWLFRSFEPTSGGASGLAASGFGYIVNENDPRLCRQHMRGMAGCTRGSTEPGGCGPNCRGLASLPPDTSVHVSGCAKGCAHPAPADLTLVGDEGTYQVVLGGTARHKPVGRAVHRLHRRAAGSRSSKDGSHAGFRDISGHDRHIRIRAGRCRDLPALLRDDPRRRRTWRASPAPRNASSSE